MPFRPEQSASQEVQAELAERFANTFVGRHDCYAVQRANGAYTSIKQPLRSDLIVAHLSGSLTLGAYALDAESNARWLCFDADDEEQWRTLRVVARHLEQDGMVPYLEQSRRGGHLWLFTKPFDGSSMRAVGNWIVKTYNLPRIELYPKQDVLKTGPGSLVRLPLGIHRKTGRRYHFISPAGEPLAATIRQQVSLLAAPFLIPSDIIEQATAKILNPPVPTHQNPLRIPIGTDEPLSERLKSTISVFDFVRRYVDLDERGKGLCPFHGDHVKSFQVNRENNYWNCYADCGGGSIIDFWMKWRRLHGQDDSFVATVKDLATILL